MYKKSETRELVYSPSDLTLFMRSTFASWMDRLALQDSSLKKSEADPMMDLLAKKGTTHETDFLQSLIEQYGEQNVARISSNKDTAAQATIDAMRAGFDVIFQAYLERDAFKGFADFLIKRPGQSALGDFYYEVWDTKLSKSTRPYFIIQLCCYNWMLEPLQDFLADDIVVVLGDRSDDGSPRLDRIRATAHYSYFKALKAQFLEFQNDFTGNTDQRPDPAFCNDFGNWGEIAESILQTSDSLSIVANIRKSQIKKLHAAGINTLEALVNTDALTIKGMDLKIFERLKGQAKIQLSSRGKEIPLFKILESEAGKGLKGLPAKSEMDVYFDIEGHPLFDGGLEYLWGVSYDSPSTDPLGTLYPFKDWWAHDRAQEKLAFEGFIDWVYARWQQEPSMHVYHYASYEITAINKLANREQTRLDEVAELLTNNVFIDLYRLVQTGLLIGEPKYSIKNVEHLYRERRNTTVANGGDSVVFYEGWRAEGGSEQWLESSNGYAAWSKDPSSFDWTLWPKLDSIRTYNIDDCESTLQLVHWLRQIQHENGIQYEAKSDALLIEKARTDKQNQNQLDRQALTARQQALIQQQLNDPELKIDEHASLLVSLLQFYIRERKPSSFAYLQRQDKSDEDLLEYDTVIFDVKIETTEHKGSKIHCSATFSIDQPLRTDKIKAATIKNTNVKVTQLTFEDKDAYRTLVSFELAAEYSEALKQQPLVLFGDEAYIDTSGLEKRLCEITETYFKTRQLSGALRTLLGREIPRIAQTPLPISRTLIPEDAPYMQAIIRAVQGLDDTVLCIQGPPGAGKTYTAQHVIEALIRAGKRVGVMSNSHAAIMNLLEPLAKDLPHALIAKVGGYPTQAAFTEKFPAAQYPGFRFRVSMDFTKAEPYESFDVVGATVYNFVKKNAYDAPLDYLFVDEASQVALANLVVASGATRNIILMGDQMQLEQPIQGAHPGDAGLSALNFMLGDHAVIPQDRGIFLERTYRMHPKVCAPLSEIVYEGKLQADAPNKNQAILLERPKLLTKESGILTLWLDHDGNTQSSEEEAAVINTLLAELKTGSFRNKDNEIEAILLARDVLVVAPYNMQVNLLKERLPADIRIGTIDKFQGQEAPVVIISMAVSDIEESPRGLDFIFDMNRLNVAVSRAKALAIIVASKKLRQVTVSNIRQMEMAGLFLRLTEQ